MLEYLGKHVDRYNGYSPEFADANETDYLQKVSNLIGKNCHLFDDDQVDEFKRLKNIAEKHRQISGFGSSSVSMKKYRYSNRLQRWVYRDSHHQLYIKKRMRNGKYRYLKI